MKINNLDSIKDILIPLNDSSESLNKAMSKLEESLSQEDQEKLTRIKKDIESKNEVYDYLDKAKDLIEKY